MNLEGIFSTLSAYSTCVYIMIMEMKRIPNKTVQIGEIYCVHIEHVWSQNILFSHKLIYFLVHSTGRENILLGVGGNML
jgi:hypothetical protein